MFDEWEAMSRELQTANIAVVVLMLVAVLGFIWFVVSYVKGKNDATKNLTRENDERLFAEVAYFHEKGKRERQEDSYFISPMDEYKKNGLVIAVSDGMGGMNYGDDISKSITEQIGGMYPLSFFASESISEDIKRISNSLYDEYGLQGGATLAMIHLYDNYMNIYSVGDSDIILIRDNRATILNPRQNYLSYLVRSLAKEGYETQDAYVNRKSRQLVDFMGNKNPRVIYSSHPMKMTDGDVIIVSSDGLTDAIPWNTLPKYVNSGVGHIASSIKMSIRNRKIPKQDNYTGIVIKLSRGLL